MIQSMSGLVCQIFAVSSALLIPQHGDGVGFGGIEGLLHLRRVGVSIVVPLTGDAVPSCRSIQALGVLFMHIHSFRGIV